MLGLGRVWLSAVWFILAVGLNILPGTPGHQVPVSSPPGSRDRVALWHGRWPEAAGSQRWLQEADHSGPSPRSAIRKHGQHPGGAVDQSHGTGPSRDAPPAAGNKALGAAILGLWRSYISSWERRVCLGRS